MKIAKPIIRLSIFILLVSLSPHLTMGQNERVVDSLINLVDNSFEDTIKINALIELGWEYNHNDFDRAEEFTLEALRLSKKLNRKRDLAASYNLLGIIYEDKNYPFDTIFHTYQLALNQFEEGSNDIFKINILNNLANSYKRAGKYDKAFELYNVGLDVAEAQGKKLTMCRILNNMAAVLRDQGYPEEALPKYRRALNYATEANRTDYRAALNNNIGLTYSQMDNLDSTLYYYSKALEQKRALGNKYNLVTTLTNLASVYIGQNKEELGLNYVQEAYDIALNIDYKYGEALALSVLTEYADSLASYQSAIDYANKGLKALSVDGDIELQIFFHESLANDYAKLGDFKAAFDNQKQYYAIKDSVYSIESEEKILMLESKYQLEQKEVENELLKAETKANKNLIKKRTWSVIAISMIAILSLIILFYVRKDNRKRKTYRENLEKEVKLKTAELQSTNQKLIDRNIELERFNYITSHDLKEPLRNINSFAGLLKKREETNLSEKGVQYLNFIQDNTHQMNFLLNSIQEFSSLNNTDKLTSVDMTDLLAGIYNEIQLIESNVLKLTYNELPIILGSKNKLYLLFKHLIQNAIKYNDSEIPSVDIKYLNVDNCHQFSVKDNGVGIKQEYQAQIFTMFKRLHNRETSQSAGMGLATCKKIITDLGGQLTLDSELGKGSTFIIRLPMR